MLLFVMVAVLNTFPVTLQAKTCEGYSHQAQAR